MDAPIAGPWLFGYAGLVGDLEFKRDANLHVALGQYWGRRATKEKTHCCSKCWATTDNADDVGAGVPWRAPAGSISSEDYLAMASAVDAVTPLAEAVNWAHELDLDDDLHMIFQGSRIYAVVIAIHIEMYIYIYINYHALYTYIIYIYICYIYSI